MLSALLRAGETWKLLATNVKQLKAFYVKCQRQILRIRWSEHVSNAVMLSCTRLTDNQLNDILAKRRNAVFGDVAWLTDGAPAGTYSVAKSTRHWVVAWVTTAYADPIDLVTDG